MEKPKDEVNVIELLIGIKEDVSSIKTDMANFKESQQKMQDSIQRDILDVRSDCKTALNHIEEKFKDRTNQLQSIQAKLVGEVDTLETRVSKLEQAQTEADARKWRKFVAYALSAFGGVFLAKLPAIIAFTLKVFSESK